MGTSRTDSWEGEGSLPASTAAGKKEYSLLHLDAGRDRDKPRRNNPWDAI